MPQQIFLSYSRRDEAIADAVAKAAKARAVTIWYDKLIPPGNDWRDSIVGAIQSSDALVILFSDESNKSRQLIKELAIADNFGKLVVPVLIEATEPRGAYLYEMASRNWINLHPGPLARVETLLDQLVARLKPLAPAAAPISSPPAASPIPDAAPQAPRSQGAATVAHDIAPPPPRPVERQTRTAGQFPVKRWEMLVLGTLLTINFLLGIRDASYPGAGFNMFLLLVYMFVVAVRNARSNIGIETWKSFSTYLGIGLLLIPFGLAIDWITGTEQVADSSLTFGLVLLSVLVAGFANLLQFALRKILQRNIFKSRIRAAVVSQRSVDEALT